MERLAVIGLDCATPQLVFGRWRHELPVLAGLMARGAWGPLRSTIPPITVPAWTCMMTSRDPGELGIYGFRNRADRSYDRLVLADSSAVKVRTVWQHLSRAGLRSLVLGVPLTWPPRPLAGAMASCFLAPSREAPLTWPESFRAELDAAAGGEYLPDVAQFRTADKGRLLAGIEEMTRRRFRAFRELFRRGEYDFGIVVEMGIDRIHHGFWRFFDEEHRLHEPGNPWQGAVLDYYRLVDREIGETLAALPAGTSTLVVSDHGAKAMQGAICLNEWLRRRGWLVLREEPAGPTPLRPEMVDWERTRAWGDGGYYGRVFLNVQGREPAGTIPPAAVAACREELAAALCGLGDEAGRPIGTVVHRPEAVYRAVRGVPPDLIVYFGGLDWRSAGPVGTGTIHLFENDTGPDDANHAELGILLWDHPRAARRAEYTIYDVAPSILDHFGLEVPAEMAGSSLLGREEERR